MNQAIAVTTTQRSRSSLGRLASAAIAAVRQIVSPAIFEEPEKETILVPVRDDGWAPDLRCGEFAIVESTNTQLIDGAFVLIRGSKNRFSIVQLSLWDESRGKIIERDGVSRAPYWSHVYGRQRVGNWQPSDEDWAPDGQIHMADGPYGEEQGREMVIGRVVGVLGAHDRALNWKGVS